MVCCATRNAGGEGRNSGSEVSGLGGVLQYDELNPPPEGEARPLVPKAPALDWPKLALLEPPPRQWAIKGWLGFGHISLLVGPGGIGKTLLAQQMASCLALGRPFIDAVERPLKCLMWACEDDHDELWRRQVAISRWCKAGLVEFHEHLTIVPRYGLENVIVSSEFGRLTFSARLGELSEQANDLQAEVVILDNVGQLFGGGENDRHAVTAFLNALGGALPGVATLLLAHPSRSLGSEFSGSSAWENVARTRLYFGSTLPGSTEQAEPVDNVRFLSRRKSNYSPKDWRRMTYADGALTPDEPDLEGGIIGQIITRKAERCVITGILKLQGLGLQSSEGNRSPNYLPKMLVEYKLNEGLTSAELASAMRALMVDGKVKRLEVGKNSQRHPVMGLALSE